MPEEILGYCSYCKMNLILTKTVYRLSNGTRHIVYSGVCPKCNKEIEHEDF